MWRQLLSTNHHHSHRCPTTTRLAVPNKICLFHHHHRHLLHNSSSHHTASVAIVEKLASKMPEEYHPKLVEQDWYEFWEKQDLFKPSTMTTTTTGASSSASSTDKSEKGNFSIALPPPNVTGSLHIGHALTISLQDALSRYKKMDGYRVLWVPGMDHAGISTQVVVEKKLSREQNGLSRHDIGREKFIDLVWEWKREFGDKITVQTKAMGAMTDWSRHVFTMDEQFSKAVIETFVRLYEDGMVYRDTKLVNWCPALKTVISDLEVDSLSLTKKTGVSIPSAHNKRYDFGVLHTFKYPIVDHNGCAVNGGECIEVSTTRLETMLGDTAVAVHPDDERYQKYHELFVRNPFVPHRKIPIICDAELVRMEFGTGVVKVTPAHSFDDYACGKRNDLEFINIMNPDGTMNANAGVEFEGKNRFEVRKLLIERLKELNLFVGEKDHALEIPVCSRSKDVIEPMLIPQWFVKCDAMARRSLELVSNGETNIYPSSYVNTWEYWLTNIHDWCISRQLWWGHRIPAYRIILNNNGSSGNTVVNDEWIVARSMEEAHSKVKQQHGLDQSEYRLEQDEDVLDTWFSSGIYPLASFGWPNQTQDLKDFYPLSVMETGSDILFFWVARMAMLCTYLQNDTKPFKDIYLHPMVRDAQGRKMSKSLGNVIDPIDVMHGITLKNLQAGVLSNTNISPDEAKRAIKVMEKDFPKGIQECGADALRFSLIKYTQQGRQINLDVQRVISNRFFCNKIWQGTRFAKDRFDALSYQPTYDLPQFVSSLFSDASSTLHNRWILVKLNQAINKVRHAMDNYHFSDAATAIYDFFMYELCDNYLECSKSALYSTNSHSDQQSSKEIRETLDTLHICFEQIFRLMHPLMPFISEELWHRIPQLPNSAMSLMITPYPAAYSTITESIAEQTERDMNLVLAAVQELRSVKTNLQTAAKETDGFVCIHDSPQVDNSNTDNTDLTALIQLFTDNRQDIVALSKFRSISIVTNEEIARLKTVEKQKLAVGPVNKNCTVYLTLPSDYATRLDAELKKLEKKLEQLQGLKGKYEKQIDTAGVPEAVKEKTREKLSLTVADITACMQSIKEMQDLIQEANN